MRKCFIYSFIKEIAEPGQGKKLQNVLAVFFPYKSLMSDVADIQIQLREYFFNNTLPDKVFIICFEYNREDVLKLFEAGSSLHGFIPKFNIDHANDNLIIGCITKDGKIESILGKVPDDSVLREMLNRGMVKIFNDKGGLIVSQSAHHFVFPSGKHCDRFLRTGNVLINGAEILFIAANIVLHFKCTTFKNIYCDTSSINSLAFAFISILKELGVTMDIVHVESFGSYELFEKSTFKASRYSLFLISSSTSGSILTRMTSNKAQNIAIENIVVIYGLSVEQQYADQVLCDLSFDKNTNPEGLSKFVSYNVKKGDQCKLCNDGSTPIKVEGDVFLLEKPNVIGHRITVNDQPAFLKSFGDFYRKADGDQSIIRAFYKENSLNDKKYEVYADLDALFEHWPNRKTVPFLFKNIFDKLEKLVLQNIPAALKYMVVLPDKASGTLAKVIADIIRENGGKFETVNILSIDELGKIDKDGQGVIAVVSSSIVTGGNLLYLSRALREFEKTYRRMFFTFLTRTEGKEHLEFLETNLGQGEFGRGTHKIVNVETIYCTQQAIKTPWHIELDFSKEFQEFAEEMNDFDATKNYFELREKELNECGTKVGLDTTLLFPSFTGNSLKLNNGFAFAPPNTNFDHATQSEVYFIIDSVLNEMRSKGKLFQTEYVRNLIEPGNFVRYNDGIIQSCILRAATREELKYHLSDEMSSQIQAILGDMISHLGDAHAEAITEFFYAICIKKLRLPDGVLRDCIKLLESQNIYASSDSILRGLVGYIKKHVLESKEVGDKFKDASKILTEMKNGR